MSAAVQRAGFVRRHGSRRRAVLAVPGLLALGVIAAACGSNSSSPPPPTGGTGSSTGTGSAATTGALVDAKSVSSLGTILVNSQGMTLYRLSTDSKNKSVCTGGCPGVWPPLLATGSGMPVGGPGVSGLGEIKVSAGEQVTFNGEPLYTFTGDTAPGQTHGQNVKDQWGTWFVVTTGGSSTSTTAGGGGATTTTSGGGGGVGF